MYRKMRRKDREIESLENIDKILDKCEYGILSTISETGYPYGIPLNYVYLNNKIYFHSATEGHKVDNFNKNNKVSFCVVGNTELQPSKFSTKYESVIIFGTINEVTGDEKNEVLEYVIKKFSNKFLQKGIEYIAKASNSTNVYKINIEHMTGKAKR